MMRLGADQRLKKSCACLACGEMLDVAAEVERSGRPLPLVAVVVTMCIACGHVMVFAGEDLRDLTKDEADRIDRDDRVIALRNVRKALLS